MLNDLSNSDHGRANREILDILQRYILDSGTYEHPIKAILSLSPEQIKSCFTQVDPLYHASKQ
jgi:hypothetical protein